MISFHGGMEELHGCLLEVERDKTRWQPVGDVMLESLQDEIDQCKVMTKNSQLSSLTVAHSLYMLLNLIHQ